MDIDVDGLLKGFEVISKGATSTDKALTLVEKLRQKLVRKGGDEDDKEDIDDSGAAPDDNETTEIILALKNEIADVKIANINLKEQVADLRSQLLKLAEEENQRDNYELVKTVGGAMVYQSKQQTPGEQPHSLCPACWDQGKKSVLQYYGNKQYRECPVCKQIYLTNN